MTLRATAEEVDTLPPVQEVAFLQLGDYPPDDPDWDVGIQEMYAFPHHPAYDLELAALDLPILYDRVPKGGVEIRRESGVFSAEGHRLGCVEASWSIVTSTSRTSSSSPGTSAAGRSSRSRSAPSQRSRRTA